MTSASRLLLGAIALLVAILALEWLLPDGGDAVHAVTGLRLARVTAKTPMAERTVRDWERTVLARPLFTMDRRPPKASSGKQSDTGPGESRLSGIMIGTFGRKAIFAPGGGGKPLVLGENAPVNDSTIKTIQPGQVVLANGTVLYPSFDKNRVVQPFVPTFQPPVPPFQPGVPGGGPGFPVPHFVQAPQPNPQSDTDSGEPQAIQPVQPIQPPVPFRGGPNFPNRRD